MFTEQALFFFYTETPLHAGSGSSIAYVDMPIQREKHTEYPIVQASGVKGAFKSWARERSMDAAEIAKVFGPEKGDEHSGALAFTDAQILLFPVRSFAGGFAWITCPTVINRLQRVLKTMGIVDLTQIDGLLSGVTDEKACLTESSVLKVESSTNNNGLILEDIFFELEMLYCDQVKAFAEWLAKHALPAEEAFGYISKTLPDRMAVLSDSRFRDFVSLSTDVQTRISIGDTGTVDQGPWNEELLLPDTLLYSQVLGKDMKYKNNDSYNATEAVKFAKEIVAASGIMQMGGDETLGRGLVRVSCLTKSAPTEGVKT